MAANSGLILVAEPQLFSADLPVEIEALKAISLASQAKMSGQDGINERKEDRIIRLEKLLADFKHAPRLEVSEEPS